MHTVPVLHLQLCQSGQMVELIQCLYKHDDTFDTQHLLKKPSMVMCACKFSAERVSMGRFLRPIGLPAWSNELAQCPSERPCFKSQHGCFPRNSTQGLTSGFHIHSCARTHLHTYEHTDAHRHTHGTHIDTHIETHTVGKEMRIF